MKIRKVLIKEKRYNSMSHTSFHIVSYLCFRNYFTSSKSAVSLYEQLA